MRVHGALELGAQGRRPQEGQGFCTSVGSRELQGGVWAAGQAHASHFSRMLLYPVRVAQDPLERGREAQWKTALPYGKVTLPITLTQALWVPDSARMFQRQIALGSIVPTY